MYHIQISELKLSWVPEGIATWKVASSPRSAFMRPIFRSNMCIYRGGRGHNRQESLPSCLKRILWLKAQIVSDFLSATSKCRLYRKTFTSNTKRLERSRVKGTIQTQKVQHRQPPHPREGFKPFTLRQRWAWGKETGVHEASKQQMASTGNLPLERLHCCLHTF